LRPRFAPAPRPQRVVLHEYPGAGELVALRGADRLAVQPRPTAGHRLEQLPGRRIEDRGRDRPGILDQRDTYRPVRRPAQEGPGTVDRIDHPDPARPRQVG